MLEIKTLTLKCSNCAGDLEITNQMECFACGYCGAQQTVIRQGGTVRLEPVVDAIQRVQAGTDKTAAELAMKRLKEEIYLLEQKKGQRTEEAMREFYVRMSGLKTVSAFVLIIAIFGSLGGYAVTQYAIVVFAGVFVILAVAVYYMGKKQKVDAEIEERLNHDLKIIESQLVAARRKMHQQKRIAES